MAWIVTKDGKLLNLDFVKRIWRDAQSGTILADLGGPVYTALADTNINLIAQNLTLGIEVIGPDPMPAETDK